ncbi:hypothetical protein BGZ60DRAFT_415175 [Tricladium varicosporioides]|nr:hypothetical protein BGZ60DRAFT_415175 [Hymenoscyphus varicosporioides]
MQFSTFVTAALFAIPALVGAAPTSDVNNNVNVLFDRAATCNPPALPKNATKAQKDARAAALSAMNTATVKAHQGEDMCAGDDAWHNAKTDADAKAIATKCVTGYTQCVQQRTIANDSCTKAGGTVDDGHKKALVFCQNKLTYWQQVPH